VKDNALRISMSFFNTEEDIEKTVGAIAREAGTCKAAVA
jgi:selenocysteine lyase/cysteine desulfurase